MEYGVPGADQITRAMAYAHEPEKRAAAAPNARRIIVTA
jgi:hypothetical protein